jgi:RNA recognition motif-containing protein
MSLFIGNIAKEVTKKELEDLFSKYGKCEINYKGAYAFAEFSLDKEAEQAKLELNKKEINGRILSIEWSKKSKNYIGNERYENISPRRKCYTCGHSGHLARDCPEGRRRSNSRRRYHSKRRYRSRSRSHHHHHRRRYRSRSSSRSSSRRSPRRKYRKRNYRRSRSKSRDRDRDRSRSRNRSRSKSYNRNSRSKNKNSENSRNYDDNKSLRSRSLNESNRSINDSHNNYNREEKNFVNDENNNMK